MALLKWKKDSNDTTQKGWVSLYTNAINERLRKDKNLSDVDDINESRKNLGLVGDVSDINENDALTHNHDKRYKHLIDLAKQALVTYVDDKISEVKTAIAALDSNIAQEEKNRKQNIESSENKMKEAYPSFYVSATEPTSPINDKTIWFCTSNNEQAIYYYTGNRWVAFGSYYK